MADALQQAAAWLDGQRKAHASRTVTYRRDERSVAVAATMGRRTYEVPAAYGASMRVEAMDFIVTAADLVLAGVRTEPEAGDRICVTEGDRVQVYEVAAPASEMNHAEAADPYGIAWRIHTKYMGTERA